MEITKDTTIYTMRQVTMDDIEAATEMFNIWSQARYGKNEFDVHNTRLEWESPDFNIEESIRVMCTPDGKMVGYVEVWDNNELPVNPWVWAQVHPDYTGQGIGTTLCEWADQRLRQAIDRCPPDVRVAYQAFIDQSDQGAADLLTNIGMQSIRHSWVMRIDMDTAPVPAQVPAGFSLRPMRYPDEMEAAARVSDEAFKDHFGHVDRPFEEVLRRWQHQAESDEKFDPNLVCFVIDDATGDYAGIAISRIEAWGDAEMGYVNTLGVLRPYRRKGLAMALLQNAFGELWARGKASVGLGVDAESLTGATDLYLKAGMYIYREHVRFEKEIRAGKDLRTVSAE